MLALVKLGNLEVLQRAQSLGLQPTRLCATEACDRGSLDILKWLVLVAKCPLSTTAYDAIARRGHFHILEFLFDPYSPFNEQIRPTLMNSTTEASTSSGKLLLDREKSLIHLLQPGVIDTQDAAGREMRRQVEGWLSELRRSCGHLDGKLESPFTQLLRRCLDKQAAMPFSFDDDY